MTAPFSQATVTPPSDRITCELRPDGLLIEFRPGGTGVQPWGCFVAIVLSFTVCGMFMFSYLGAFVVLGIGVLWLVDVLTRGRRRTALELTSRELVLRRGRRQRTWPLDALERLELVRREPLGRGDRAASAALVLRQRDAAQVELIESGHAGDLAWIADVTNRALQNRPGASTIPGT